MRHRPRAFAALGLTASAIVITGSGAPGGDVSVTVTDLRSDKGLVQACLTTNPHRFPDCKGDAHAYALTVPASDVVHIDFGQVPPGRYAIALLHDENGNGRADRALMLPKEGFGFSRDAALRLGPPKFAAAAFDVGSGPVEQTIRMRYLF